MSFIPVFKYILGLGLFGFLYWLLDNIMILFIDENIHTTGTTFNIIHALWTASLLVYLIFGGWQVIRQYNEQNNIHGGGL